MKRSLFTKPFKQTMLAVPAAALMLGAAHGQTTVGINVVGQYSTYGTIGTGYAGYQMTGFAVTAPAFGVPTASWVNSSLLQWGNAGGYATSATIVTGAITVNLNYGNIWVSDAGDLDPYPYYSGGGGIGGTGYFGTAGAVNPGNDQVTWAIEDTANGGWQNSLSGLNTTFPNGYVLELISASGNTGAKLTSSSQVTVTDGASVSDTLSFGIYPVTDGAQPGTVGLAATPTLNSDAITMTMGSGSASCSLAGFILTDQPVVTYNVPTSLLLASGASLVLPPPTSIIGIGLTYQWQHAGTNLPGATFSSYTNNSVATTDSGLYQAVVSSTFFPSTSVTGQVASVTVVPTHPARTADWDPAQTGAPHDGSGTWGYTLTNWWSGSIDDYWGSADSAVFGAGGTGAYTVTLTADVTANAITFDSGAYTITNNPGLTLTLQGAATITANANATISTPLSTETNTLVTAGADTLTISGALTCTNTFVSAGTLQVLAKNGDSPYSVTNGATLKIGYTTGSGYAKTAMTIYGNGAAATTGFYLAGGQTYNVNGGVVVDNAPTTIRQYGTGLASLGFFDINQNPGLSITAAASGSATDPNIQLVSDGYGMVVTTEAGTNTATGDLTINGPLNVNANNGVYGLSTRGSGSVRLNAVAAVANCGLQIQGGTVICGIANCIGANAVLNVSFGATLNLNGTSQTVTNAMLAGTLEMTINQGGSPNCNTLNSPIQPLTYGGTLMVTNVGGPLALGDSFLLFPTVGGGAFTNLVLPALPNGLAWQDNSAVDGTIDVITGSVPPGIVNDLSAGTNYAFVGGDSTFAITASGDPILQYQWRENGTTVVGLNSPTLTLTSLSPGSDGDYSCTVTNNFGTAQSQTNYLLVTAPSLVQAAMVQDTPTAFWPLNEINPPTAYDYWAGNNGTQNGNLTLGVAGPVPPADAGFGANATAYLFDGSSAYVDCGTGPALSGTTDFTLEAWVNTTSTVYGQILQQRSAAGYIGEYTFGVNGNGTLSFTLYGSGGYQFDFNSTNTSTLVNDGNWHHVVAVRSGANGLLYIDGNLVGAASGSEESLAPLEVYIGVDLRSYASYFDGTMCDVAIYSHALSPARIADHAEVGIAGGPLTLNVVGKNLVWSAGTLLSTPVLGSSAVWTPVSGATSPYALPPAGLTNSTLFYRLQF